MNSFNTIFSISFAVIVMTYLVLMMRILTKERWQMVAAIPWKKKGEQWEGINLTFYGVFNANAYTFAVVILLVMMASMQTPLLLTICLTFVMLLICVPASRIVARIVEKRKHTITIGGATFVGAIMAPILIWLTNTFVVGQSWSVKWFGDQPLPEVPLLAALVTAYMFGEGMGRLACVSFGCCYGKPVSETHGFLRSIFNKWHFVFEGDTRKACYDGHGGGKKLVPIQGMTALFLTMTGTINLILFLNGFYYTAMLTGLVISQGWRFLSEFFRRDFRGGGKISPYQVMSLLMVIGGFCSFFIYGHKQANPAEIKAGLAAIWNPGTLLFFQFIWIATLLATGLSEVTGSSIEFCVHTSRVGGQSESSEGLSLNVIDPATS